MNEQIDHSIGEKLFNLRCVTRMNFSKFRCNRHALDNVKRHPRRFTTESRYMLDTIAIEFRQIKFSVFHPVNVNLVSNEILLSIVIRAKCTAANIRRDAYSAAIPMSPIQLITSRIEWLDIENVNYAKYDSSSWLNLIPTFPAIALNERRSTFRGR